MSAEKRGSGHLCAQALCTTGAEQRSKKSAVYLCTGEGETGEKTEEDISMATNLAVKGFDGLHVVG